MVNFSSQYMPGYYLPTIARLFYFIMAGRKVPFSNDKLLGGVIKPTKNNYGSINYGSVTERKLQLG